MISPLSFHGSMLRMSGSVPSTNPSGSAHVTSLGLLALPPLSPSLSSSSLSELEELASSRMSRPRRMTAETMSSPSWARAATVTCADASASLVWDPGGENQCVHMFH